MLRRIGVQEVIILALFIIMMILATDPVFAATGSTPGGGTGLPWEQWITRIVQSLTGPVAYGFVVTAFLISGIKWYQGGDFGTVGFGFLTAGIIGAVVVAAAQFVSILYAGAVI